MVFFYTLISKRPASVLKIIIGIALLLLFTFSAKTQSILLNGSSNYGSAGNNAALRLTNFTLEAWIKIEGTGIITSNGTGSGGHTNIVPILTKGRSENENALLDVNYFLGYDLTTNKLQADFEDNATSLNHPVTSNAVLGNCWTHVAASYSTSTNTWKLYINGVLDQSLALGASYTPQSLSNVNTCIGSAFNSTGATSGFFNGKIDEVRIWNIERTGAEILANYNTELTSGTGLACRWGFNDASGVTGTNAIAGAPEVQLNNSPIWKPGFNFNKSLLDFNGTSGYVTFGSAASLNTTTFTLEAWIMIEGAGVTTTTSSAGGGGFEGATAVVPLVTKGRGEAETPANINMNYFMGLVGNKLAADFEEAAGLNHSVVGTATIPLNTWTHVAATYEPVTAVWNLYINGVLDKTLDIGTNILPASTSIQHAGVGTGLTSTGAAAGFFNGKIDEVRIWNVVRSASQIVENYNAELTSGTGLLGRWGFNEGCGLTSANSVGGVNGTLSGTTVPAWAISNFNSQAPLQPLNPSPANNANTQITSPNLCATVSDPNSGNLQVRFFGRKKFIPGAKFTIIGLPDTQFYTEEPQGQSSGGGGHNGIFKAQTQWIANHRVDSSIAFVSQLGDCTQSGDTKEIEFKRADTAIKNIENPNVPIPFGIPYGICVGNHDQGPTGNPDGTSTFYNQYFGDTRFAGRSYYGGHYGSNNDNHYQLFSAGGIDFIHISLEYYANGTTASLLPVLNWADALLKTYSNRKGILSTHNLLTVGNPASFQGPGQKIYDELKDNANLILMLAGHVHGEGRRTDIFNGNTIHSIMSDYQSGTNGGNGYLRIMQFIQNQNLLSVKTYSPYTNSSLTGTSSDFTLPINLSPAFTLLETKTNVTAGSVSCVQWPSLLANTDYEWFVEISDGENITTGPVWNFKTANPLPVTLSTFTAVKDQEKVKLNWETQTEINSSHFELERSADGVKFDKLGTIAAKGLGSPISKYDFDDVLPLSGNNFYRLKQIDQNGSFKYSDIIRVYFAGNAAGSFQVFPNPAEGNNLKLIFKQPVSGNIMVSIYDALGKLSYIKTQTLNSNSLSFSHNLSPGVYIIKILSDNINESNKVIISK